MGDYNILDRWRERHPIERKLYCNYCDEYVEETHSHENDGPLCECGHYEADHHRSWFMPSTYFPEGGKIVEECEYYGYNETGGMEQNAEGKWVDHCQRFRLRKEDDDQS